VVARFRRVVPSPGSLFLKQNFVTFCDAEQAVVAEEIGHSFVLKDETKEASWVSFFIRVMDRFPGQLNRFAGFLIGPDIFNVVARYFSLFASDLNRYAKTLGLKLPGLSCFRAKKCDDGEGCGAKHGPDPNRSPTVHHLCSLIEFMMPLIFSLMSEGASASQSA